MNVSKHIIRNISTGINRRAAAAPKSEISKGYFELRKIQEHFQRNDGKPVFLKGGPMDQVLYRLTVGLSVIGVGGVLKLIYDLSFPKPPE